MQEKIRLIIENWATQQGHDRCWYYPEVFREIAELVGAKISFPPGLPPRIAGLLVRKL